MLLFLALPAAAAQSAAAAGNQIAFSRIDSDHNGYVSRVEARPVVADERFEAADANRDGLLDREEYSAMHSDRQTEY